MDENRQHEQRHSHRALIIVQRFCSLGLITFKSLEWTNLKAHLVDLSRSGVGIESDDRVEPGFVWFKDRVGGHKGGVLMWSKRLNAKYRAGIRFVSLSRDEEKYVQEQVAQLRPHRPLRDPEAIIATLLESIKKDAAGNH
jgi:hypothetical protein